MDHLQSSNLRVFFFLYASFCYISFYRTVQTEHVYQAGQIRVGMENRVRLVNRSILV